MVSFIPIFRIKFLCTFVILLGAAYVSIHQHQGILLKIEVMKLLRNASDTDGSNCCDVSSLAVRQCSSDRLSVSGEAEVGGTVI